MIKIMSALIKNVATHNITIQKIATYNTILWENWILKTGQLAKRTWVGNSREGLVYSSGEIALDNVCKIHEFTLFSKCIRNDISGRISGKFIIYGWTGTAWVTLLNTVSDTNAEWGTNFTRTVDSSKEVTKLKYEFYVNDTIWRSYTSDFRLQVSKWEQKGA